MFLPFLTRYSVKDEGHWGRICNQHDSLVALVKTQGRHRGNECFVWKPAYRYMTICTCTKKTQRSYRMAPDSTSFKP